MNKHPLTFLASEERASIGPATGGFEGLLMAQSGDMLNALTNVRFWGSANDPKRTCGD